MKINLHACLALAAVLIPWSTADAAVTVDFSGGLNTPLSFSIPVLTWQVTDAATFNSYPAIGIGIAVGEIPAFEPSVVAMAGDPAAWSSNGAVTFGPPVAGSTIFTNNNFSALNGGGIIWFEISTVGAAVDGDIITFAGGTLSSAGNVAPSFADGDYEVYLINSSTGAVVSSAANIPEPATELAGLLGFGLLARRRRRHRAEA